MLGDFSEEMFCETEPPCCLWYKAGVLRRACVIQGAADHKVKQTMQQSISAIKVLKSGTEEFSGKAVDIVHATLCVMAEELRKKTDAFTVFSPMYETICQIWNELLD